MPDCIARLIEPLLRLLLPSHGRHRLTPTLPCHPATATRGHDLRLVSGHLDHPIPGEATHLVRPYLLTPDERLRRQRRRALWLATHGIDVGPRNIHGMEVAA
ncbi:hypothetical protein ACFWVU_04385 [Streptomyces sp. NPDC058686]|uniref:hypothetical protein n=1 Tax=Streptomyces sp. NPDC058686 TaxID=3346599 RepID=UPI0036692740